MTKVTQARLQELFTYDAKTGNFFWKISINPRALVGDLAGKSSINNGYRQIGIDKHLYSAHRLVWLWFHGSFPKNQIDHINGIRSDNRIENLRDVSQKINTWNLQKAKKNNKSGYLGVDWKSSHKKWRAQIRINGVKKQIGLFDSAEEAHDAYLKEKKAREQI